MYDPTILCARPGCGKPLTTRQRCNRSRCCSPACANALRCRKPDVLCAGRGCVLNRDQRKRAKAHGDQFCGRACRAGATAQRRCVECGAAMPASRVRAGYKRCRACLKATRTTEANIDAPQVISVACADLTPQNGAQRVLWTEGRTVYTVGVLNGVAVVYDGPGRVYCTLGAWEQSTAGRRSRVPKARPVVLFDEPVRSAWRRETREVEG